MTKPRGGIKFRCHKETEVNEVYHKDFDCAFTHNGVTYMERLTKQRMALTAE